jgi:hypothetical protein
MRKILVLSLLIIFLEAGCTRSTAGADIASPPLATSFSTSVAATPSVDLLNTKIATTIPSKTVHKSGTVTFALTSTSTMIPSKYTISPVTVTPLTGTPPPTPTTKVPMDVPVKVWRDIPVMPEAVTGDEGQDRYRFMLTGTVETVRDYYKAELPKLGWKYDAQGVGENGAPIFIFTKGNKLLSVSIIVLGDIVIVTLAHI